ncbi:MAG: OmpA family protein [Gammaproteobacteria bacterium]|nr:OmpA family protein [Gammaproteobacteria bacterium]
MSKSTAVLVALASLLLLTWATVVTYRAPIEEDLVQRVQLALSSHGLPPLEIHADGRDLSIGGEVGGAVDPANVADVAGQVWGVRRVSVAALVVRGTMLDADDPLNPRFDTSRIIRLGGDLSNPMGARTCQRTMARLAAASLVRFEAGGASPVLDSYPVLNDLAAVAYQCPDTDIIIGGHTDASGNREQSLRLSQARAEAVERFFYLAGIAADRMRIVAYGDSQPIASNATAEGRAANRRITFEIRTRD